MIWAAMPCATASSCGSGPCPDLIPQTFIAAGTTCNRDSGRVCLPISPSQLQNIAIQVDDVLYELDILPCDYDSVYILYYNNLPGQGLAGPYTILNWQVGGQNFSGSFSSAQQLAGLMAGWDPAGGWEAVVNPIDQTVLITGNHNAAPLVILQNQSQIQISLAVNPAYVPRGISLLLAQGDHQIFLQDTVKDCSDLVRVRLSCMTTQYYSDTLETGQVDFFCPDLSELPGLYDTTYLFCNQDSGDASVAFSPEGNCLIYSGESPGFSQICLLLCDDLSVCDTAVLSITVLDTLPPPLAQNDTARVAKGQQASLPVLENDQVAGLLQLFLVTFPTHGVVTFQSDGTMGYLPDEGYCDETALDSFSYAICNLAGCDTALVYVQVTCAPVLVYNAMSPNGDGINDCFTIKGLEYWPLHRISVFNRWGNLVFRAENYQNDWDGRWQGQLLPDGTYFYVLELGGDNGLVKGYLQIMK
jgi:gliding motility-associated-like protein